LFSLHLFSFVMIMRLQVLTMFPVLPGLNHWKTLSVIKQSRLYIFVTCGMNAYYRMHFKNFSALLWILVTRKISFIFYHKSASSILL
jgi:hypothetical protein